MWLNITKQSEDLKIKNKKSDIIYIDALYFKAAYKQAKKFSNSQNQRQ